MKLLLPTLIVAAILLSNCKKSADTITPINCDGLVTDTLGTNDNGRIYMPTAFTPNGDGLNDLLVEHTENILSLTLTIYDGSNNIVFTTTDLHHYWASQPSSVNLSTIYYYKIQAITASNHHIGECGVVYALTCLPGNLPISSLHFEDQLQSHGFTGNTNDYLPVCP